MDKKSLLKDYFNFTRKERIAVLIITGLLIIIFFIPLITKKSAAVVQVKRDSAWLAAIHQLKKANADSVDDDNARSFFIDKPNSENKTSATQPELFYFDPNTISAEQWERLGVKEKTVHTIKNYLSKGGAFRKREDLQKIYGLSQQQYDQLAPYVKIRTSAGDHNSISNEREKENAFDATRTPAHLTAVDINISDTTQLISLPGIGSKLAKRIIGFRDKLGGFYSVDQVGETYGLQDSVFQKIKKYLQCNDISVKRININTATKDELKMHPYIRWNIANAIIEYRNQHGQFTSVEDLKKINAVDKETLNKIMHYLAL